MLFPDPPESASPKMPYEAQEAKRRTFSINTRPLLNP